MSAWGFPAKSTFLIPPALHDWAPSCTFSLITYHSRAPYVSAVLNVHFTQHASPHPVQGHISFFLFDMSFKCQYHVYPSFSSQVQLTFNLGVGDVSSQKLSLTHCSAFSSVFTWLGHNTFTLYFKMFSLFIKVTQTYCGKSGQYKKA